MQIKDNSNVSKSKNAITCSIHKKKTLREYRVNSHKVGLRPPCAELGTEI